MARVRVDYAGTPVDVFTGAQPPDAQTPITNPEPTNHKTNEEFPLESGIYCFGIKADPPCATLWKTVQIQDGALNVVSFP